MKSRTKIPSLFALLLAAAAVSACSGGSDRSHTGETGRAAFRLTATSASGRVYRLVGAVIDVQGTQTVEMRGPLDPTDPQVTMTAGLAPGAYQFALRAGWTMYRVPADGAPVEVPAQLTGPNPVMVEIASGQDAPVTFHFQVGGETIPAGSATVGIDVDEPDGGLPPLPDPSTVPVIIPANVHVTDEATRAALVAYSPADGTLRFAQSTPLLAGLVAGDVLVSAPSDAAPAGYLRKIVSVSADGAEVILETTQANLTDAVSQGVLDDGADLFPSHVLSTEYEMEGVTIEPVPPEEAPAPMGDDAAGEDGEEFLALGVGTSYDFRMKFTHTFIPVAGAGGITVDGSIQFNVGYGVHVGISGCVAVPPVCVDSFQASVGFNQSAHLSIVGTATGVLGSEVKIATQYYSPQVFFIGPVPVVIVPSLTLYLTAGGQVEARVEFHADEHAVAQLGARWTDEDGWQDISGADFGADISPVTFSGVIKPRAAAKMAMSLKLYGLAGPELSLEGGVELDGRIPRNPIWIVNTFLIGKLGFRVDLPIIGTIANYETTLFNSSRELGRAPNSAPNLELTDRAKSDPGSAVLGLGDMALPWVEVRESVDFTPGCKGSLAAGIYFTANDPEDGCVGVTIVSDKEGPLPYKYTFTSVGHRILTITAKDSQGASVSKKFVLAVVNSKPTITLRLPPAAIYQGSPIGIAATITDPNEADPSRLCADMLWEIAAPDTKIGGGCLPTVTFGTTGSRQVTVSTMDSDGAVGSTTVTVNVLPPPVNLYPVLNGAKVYRRDDADPNVGFCPLGELCCAANIVADRGTLDLTASGCGSPNAYFVAADVENPTGEPLIYEWTLRHSNGSALVSQSSSSPHFEVSRAANIMNGASKVTADCQVIVTVTAPEEARNKGPLPVWQGKCTYLAGGLR